jgi:site-specific recombinase XerD
MNLNDALQKFLEDRSRRCVPRIVKWYGNHISLFIRWMAEDPHGTLELARVTLDHVERYIDSLRGRERMNRPGTISPVTIQKRAAAIRTFLQWAYKSRLIEINLVADYHLPKVGRRLPKCLTPDQVRTLLSEAMTARERAAVYLILDSGLRVSEAANLEISDLDLERGVAHVQHGKGDKERFVVFGDAARFALQAWIKERYAGCGETALFLGQRGQISPAGLYKIIKRVAMRAGVDLYPHMLRHTFATQYLDAGGSLVDLRDLLGHTDIKTTTIYVSVSLERLREKHKSLSPLSRLGNGTKPSDSPSTRLV